METVAEVKGLQELLRDLNTLPVRVESNVVRGALREGIKVMAQELGRRIPVGPPRRVSKNRWTPGGDLLRSVRIRARLKASNPQVLVSVGNKQAWYAHILEKGTYHKPGGYQITARRAKALAAGGRFFRTFHHPGIKGKFFVRETFTRKEGEAIQAFKRYLDKRLPKELSKQGQGR